MSSAFIVLDVTDLLSWPVRYQVHHEIPAEARPTILHTSAESAGSEALRLCQSTGRRFAVFEPMQLAIRVDVPTHVSLDGKTFFSEPVARLAAVGDGVPF